jgi:hypothetical protein
VPLCFQVRAGGSAPACTYCLLQPFFNHPPACAAILLLMAGLLACGPVEVFSMTASDGPHPFMATAHVEPRQTADSVLSSLLVTLQIEPAGQAPRGTSQVSISA